MLTHRHDLGDNILAGPLNTKNLGQLFEIGGCSLSNRKDRITEPAHTQGTELLIEELDTKLTSKERNVFDDS